jgi:mRNA interferase HigB
MRLITRRTIERYADEHASAAQALSERCAMIEAARWRSAEHVRETSHFPARSLGGNRIIFNIKGNDFRIIAELRYADEARGLNGIAKVCFVGTHAEYDRIDAESVSARPS